MSHLNTMHYCSWVMWNIRLFYRNLEGFKLNSTIASRPRVHNFDARYSFLESMRALLSSLCVKAILKTYKDLVAKTIILLNVFQHSTMRCTLLCLVWDCHILPQLFYTMTIHVCITSLQTAHIYRDTKGVTAFDPSFNCELPAPQVYHWGGRQPGWGGQAEAILVRAIDQSRGWKTHRLVKVHMLRVLFYLFI